MLDESSQEIATWAVKFENKPNRRTVLFPDLFETKQSGQVLFTLTPIANNPDSVFESDKIKVTT